MTRDLRELAPNLRAALSALLESLGVSREAIEREIAAMTPVTFRRATNRRVLGSMNDFASQGEAFGPASEASRRQRLNSPHQSEWLMLVAVQVPRRRSREHKLLLKRLGGDEFKTETNPDRIPARSLEQALRLTEISGAEA